jgi:hypothetical protein
LQGERPPPPAAAAACAHGFKWDLDAAAFAKRFSGAVKLAPKVTHTLARPRQP